MKGDKMATGDNWLEVSRSGLRELQEGKPKHFIVRELVQNAWDEKVTYCKLTTSWNKGVAKIEVEDDSPEGFRDLSDAFTLFSHTYKRSDPEKRGRFNLGEKEVLAMCDYALIRTTKGTLVFDNNGRHRSGRKRIAGTVIMVHVKMKKFEYDDMLKALRKYMVPDGIRFSVNGEEVLYRRPFKVFEATLPTEYVVNGVFTRTRRKTRIHVMHRNPESGAMLYELGIPVCEIECLYDIDVQQKVPLSTDRSMVPESYLSNVYAEVLNAVYEVVPEECASEQWIREAIGNSRIGREALKDVIEKRFGDKVVVANQWDRTSIDRAVSEGYRVIRGQDLSKAEWTNVHQYELIKSSSVLFGTRFVGFTEVDPDDNMRKVAELARKIAKGYLGVDILVKFARWEGNTGAEYGNKELSFNVACLGVGFFNPPLSEKVIDLIVHEICHERGLHTQASYHNALTGVCGMLVMIALKEPEFFEVD
ncbi:MAG: hypothetical protein AB1401_00605 [Thermodesulfobacteriota bacterium]